MRGFGSAWWHTPSLIVATTVMAIVVFTIDPTRAVLGGEILVFAALTAVLIRRDRRVYLPRRLEAERAGLIKRASIGPVPMLIWCAFVAATQLMPHHTTPVGDLARVDRAPEFGVRRDVADFLPAASDVAIGRGGSAISRCPACSLRKRPR